MKFDWATKGVIGAVSAQMNLRLHQLCMSSHMLPENTHFEMTDSIRVGFSTLLHLLVVTG